MHIKALFIILLLSFNLNVFSQKGKLEKGKESLKTKNTSSFEHTSKSSKSGAFVNRDSSFGEQIATFFLKVFLIATYGVAFETPMEFNSRMHDAEIAHYPFEKGHQGNFIYTDSTNYMSIRFDIRNNFVIENNSLYGNNFAANFRFLKRFALDVDHVYLTEKVAEGKDFFSMYSSLLKYYRIRTQRFDAWYGLGAVYVASGVNTFGFGAGFGAEWFVVKPISLDFSHKWGYINENTVNKTKLLLKYHIKNYHISSGYEQFKIGVSKIDAFSIGIGLSF
jgi:hypothetical protein